MNNILDAKITAKKLVNKSGLNEKMNTLAKREEIKLLATKTELKAEQNKIVKLETYELLVKVTLSMMEHDFTWCVNHFIVSVTLSGVETLKYRPFRGIFFSSRFLVFWV